jgi:hypothetical protein
MKNHVESTHPRLVASKKLQTFQVYDCHQVHNMLIIMFNPHFKSLIVEKNYVGHWACIPIAYGYDANVIIPLLMIGFEILNPIVQACLVGVTRLVARFSDFIEEDNNIFGVGTFMEESLCALLVGELSLFRRLCVTPITCANPLAWW